MKLEFNYGLKSLCSLVITLMSEEQWGEIEQD
jgi:hypothetical protein